jgi:hypothetical protein
MLNLKAYKNRERKFNDFISKYIQLTSRTYTTYERLADLDFDADTMIAGGDQLWNVYHECGKDDAYKLTFFGGKKISYATSMGQRNFSGVELTSLAAKLRSFSAVSVRESSSVELLASKGIQATHCLDPVFLLSSEHYKQFLKPVNEPSYLLVYLVAPSDLLEKAIEFFSKKYKLKVILCSGFSKKCTYDAFYKDLGPDEILSYIVNARIVLSSSFHATIFSYMFKKDFFTILPGEQTNERITDFLSMVQLEHRIISNADQINDLSEVSIQYSLKHGLDSQIEASKKFIADALK